MIYFVFTCVILLYLPKSHICGSQALNLLFGGLVLTYMYMHISGTVRSMDRHIIVILELTIIRGKQLYMSDKQPRVGINLHY